MTLTPEIAITWSQMLHIVVLEKKLMHGWVHSLSFESGVQELLNEGTFIQFHKEMKAQQINQCFYKAGSQNSETASGHSHIIHGRLESA